MNTFSKMAMMRDNTESRGRNRDGRGRFTSEYENEYQNTYNNRMREESKQPRRSWEITENERGNGGARSEYRNYADTYPEENGNSPMEGDPTRGPSRGSSGFEANSRNYPYRGESDGDGFRGELNGMRMIGFNGGTEMHYRYPHTGDEMSHHSGSKERGYSHSEAAPKLDRETAKEWVKSMTSSLDEKEGGERWSFEQANNILNQHGFDHKPAEWYAILNAVYNDYGKLAKKYGQIGNQEFFVDMAHAWLDDKDAVKDKAAMYYYTIAKH